MALDSGKVVLSLEPLLPHHYVHTLQSSLSKRSNLVWRLCQTHRMWTLTNHMKHWLSSVRRNSINKTLRYKIMDLLKKILVNLRTCWMYINIIKIKHAIFPWLMPSSPLSSFKFLRVLGASHMRNPMVFSSFILNSKPCSTSEIIQPSP